ncbi:MAG TPA: CAP domain-containing protein [Flavobacteriaceae bacterium]|nr:CAP domain-containing protein [Flavobacteriaceae bacterium]
MKKITPILLFILSSFFLTSCSQDEDGIYHNSTIEEEVYVAYTDMELEVLNLVNNYRAVRNLPALNKLNIVSYVAETHSSYMAETGLVNHDNFSKRNSELVEKASAKAVGENVAFGFNSANAVVNAWINSDSHRKILENEDYTHFGVAIETNSQGRHYFTQMFIKK